MIEREGLASVSSLKVLTLFISLSPGLLLLGSGVTLEENAYDGLLIAIHPLVPENQHLIQNIKEMMTEASFYLFNATKRRAYFRNINVLIPSTWKANNYRKATRETYENANVIVASRFGTNADNPYTLQYGGCGEEGKYIHFTPNFLVNDNLTAAYGSRGRVFVHEWAHLRWGVFDEYNNEKPFYMAGENQVKVTRCSSNLSGIFVCEKSNCIQGDCVINELTGLFKEGCMFIHNDTQTARGSIMYMQSLSSVVEFCDENTHNKEAPNLQNKMCSLRSTWDVIKHSADFSGNHPMSGDQLPPPPSFSMLQMGARLVCLVLDVSKRMSEADRLHRLRQAAELYLLQIIESLSYVGIVSFNSQGQVRAQLSQITHDGVRRQLASHLPTTVTADKEASVCAGLKTGFEVIKKLNGNTHGSVVILVTTGEDKSEISCVSSLVDSGSTVHLITLGSSGSENLEEIATLTGGLKFFASDRADSNSLMDAFCTISPGSGDMSKQFLQLESVGGITKPYHHLGGTVTIDSDVGNNTVFVVTWQTGGPPEIEILDPNGEKYSRENFDISSVSQLAYLRIPDTATAGHWTYMMNNTNDFSQALKITVISRASDSITSPATVKAQVNKDVTHFPHPVIIYADVRQGYYPILVANVTAIIETESGDPVSLELFDDGAGADVAQNDGIYSRYFFSFAGTGRHSLKVHVLRRRTAYSTAGSWAMYVPGHITNGNIQMNAPKLSMSDHNVPVQKWGISRTASGGSFSVLEVPIGHYSDVFPPCKIIDLEADKEEDSVILSWTAPGDDFDQGQAVSYEIRISQSLQRIRDDFKSAVLVNSSKLIPQPAGSKEIFVFAPEHLTEDQQAQLDGDSEGVSVIYMAVRARDKVSLLSDVSNIAQALVSFPAKTSTGVVRDSFVLGGVLIAIGLIAVICLTILATHYALNLRKQASKRENRTKLL
ncbi:calcium-activated chloride channel regulator 2 [Tachyglossus aculeatus]|uniref:calcium-activated chloride channel regulator 2 n=1 Tax=Tachyglossus aculeatus TaxID=9261 RepID=UPI0018F2F3C7|nr:calcium-activated chloride channel regulator 2 [Tachyglossus aculeatus]